jgi:ribosomal protein S1
VHLELPGDVAGFARRGDLGVGRRDPSTLVGAELEGVVLDTDSETRVIKVSPRRLAVGRCRDLVGKRRRVRIQVGWGNRGGLVATVYGRRAFLPRSELRPREAADHERLAGTRRRAYVIDANSENIVLSSYSPRKRARRARGRELLATRRRPLRVEVRAAVSGGLVVDVYGWRAFIPRSHLKPRDAARLEQLVGARRRAYVLEAEDGRIILSAYSPAKRRRRAARTGPQDPDGRQDPGSSRGTDHPGGQALAPP